MSDVTILTVFVSKALFIAKIFDINRIDERLDVAKLRNQLSRKYGFEDNLTANYDFQNALMLLNMRGC